MLRALWVLSSAADATLYYLQDVGALMGSWTKQMGFPLVTVEERQLDGNRRELRVQQRRFLADGGKDEAASLWQVPIPVTVSSDPSKPKAKFLLDKAEDKFILEGVGPNEWVKVRNMEMTNHKIFAAEFRLCLLLSCPLFGFHVSTVVGRHSQKRVECA